MKVLVKILQGKECVVEISPTETVLELKNKVSELLGVDVPQQKLLLTGKALADENPLSFYPGIKDGSKLNLVVKKSSQGPSEEKQATKSGTVLLRESVTKILKHYYSESETETIVNEMIKDLRNKVNNLSFDDLERLATTLIQDQESIG
ncbi:ubiquitin-like protein 4A [Diachasma alloeum]|uniref:ubiquitin-like protein 4A n=1 Tax=Diachasma alloeum TaxID=454923 RepID=UPI0007381FE1|nr:ubiquitin-like protein 4A [Diachasma alloeum]